MKVEDGPTGLQIYENTYISHRLGSCSLIHFPLKHDYPTQNIASPLRNWFSFYNAQHTASRCLISKRTLHGCTATTSSRMGGRYVICPMVSTLAPVLTTLVFRTAGRTDRQKNKTDTCKKHMHPAKTRL